MASLGVGNQLAQKDLTVRIDRMNHQIQKGVLIPPETVSLPFLSTLLHFNLALLLIKC